MVEYRVGETFPGDVPTEAGTTLELRDQGLVLLIQCPEVRKEEIAAFRRPIRKYWLVEGDDNVPLAYWIFQFSHPLNEMECNFDVKLCNQERLGKWLDATDGMTSVLTIYLLDGTLLKGIKTIRLQAESVNMLKDIIQDQIAASYTDRDITVYLQALMQFNAEGLKSMGRMFTPAS
ncbi:hypothetical protein JCM15519_01210 [Fundidesulfovibrio butyratiphilus]